MKLIIKGSPKEIAALVQPIQEQPKKVETKVDLDIDALCQSLTSALKSTE